MVSLVYELRVVAGDAVLADRDHHALRRLEVHHLIGVEFQRLAQVQGEGRGHGAVGDDHEIAVQLGQVVQHAVDVTEDRGCMQREGFRTAMFGVVGEGRIPDLEEDRENHLPSR